MPAARPKDELTAFDVLVLAEELTEAVGSYMDKILQPSEKELLLRLKKPGGGKRELVVEQGKWVFLREKEAGEGAPPPAFAMLLRKHLENDRIRFVAQHGFERIIVLGTEGGYELVLELFGEGNIVLVKEGTIVQPLRSQSWEHREIRTGRSYIFPPARTDPRELDEAKFSALLVASRGDLVRTLAVSVNLGGRYAEEVCARTGLRRDLRVGKLPPQEVRALLSAVRGIFSQLSKDRRPTLYLDGAIPVDFAPISLQVHADLVEKTYPDLNSLIADYLECRRDSRNEEARSSKLAEELHRIQRQAENQEKALLAFQLQATGHRRSGETVSCHVDDISPLIRRVEELRRSGGWKAVETAISRQELAPVIEARPHEGLVVARLADAEGKALDLLLDVRKSARENAARYFSASKDAVEKARRTAEQLEESRAAIERLAREGLPGEKAPKKPKAPRRQHWFERYRWFLSSDGNIVIGGRDASSNDRLVKRHLKEGDVYAHADFHGAPSIVVKRGKGEIPPTTLREACLFALACSKAWAAGVASGSAYWVNPDQVSKTPESGEYLSKGAFVIRGRKHFHHDLGLRLAIGEIGHEGDKLLMCGPESALKARSGKFLGIQPGDEEPKAVAGRLAKELGRPPEEVLRLLPPGKSQLLVLPG